MPPVSQSARVLVVDDEAPIREMLMDRLRLAGYECAEAGSADQALAEWDRFGAELVITDLRMPGRSGLDLLAALRQQPGSHTAVILATAESDIQVAIAAMKEGASDYLLKPFQFDLVLAAIVRALEKTRLQRELENYRQHLEQMVADRTAQLRAAMRHIEDTYDATLQALGAALDLRATEVAGHSLRVSLYTEEMACRMGISGVNLRNVIRGAYLHDIGKLGIPDAILLKTGRLTPQEKAVMESHVRIGFEMVQRIEFLAIAAEIVHNHQERFDGAGYPRGLRGEAIPLPARIFSVADALDAMTSDRPYRAALSFPAARAEIVRESGRQFDPQVVQV
ncbi:MAG: HD domain-containing phosphohydrolase, partial [Terriglobales bacterium]